MKSTSKRKRPAKASTQQRINCFMDWLKEKIYQKKVKSY